MTVHLRPDDLPDDAVLLVHLGAGEDQFVIKAALRNYVRYRHLNPEGWGRFTVSVFAAFHPADRQRILTSFGRRRYGTATAGQVRAHFPLLATSDDDPELDERVRRLQSLHYDIELPGFESPLLRSEMPFADLGIVSRCTKHLAPHVATLLGLFLPRQEYAEDGGAH